MKNFESHLVSINGWVIRIRQPEGKGVSPVHLLLHGWSGDEKSMLVFSHRFPSDHLLVAPRGIFPAQIGGYAWNLNSNRSKPRVEGFRGAVESLARLLDPVYLPTGDLSRVYLTGFSEGAALAYTFGILQPEHIAAIAGLSGFAPEDMSMYIENKPLSGKNIFVTHGTRDRLVPVLQARQAVLQLEAAGGKISYCEDDVGHKLSASCFRGLEAFYAEQIK